MKYYVSVAVSTLVAGCLGHMYPSSPCARGSPVGSCNYPAPDYNLMAPIATDQQPNAPLCHHAEPYASPVETVSAGSSISVNFEGSAIHNGGHCEFSLSYDGGKTFVAIQTILKTCFLEGKSFNVPIPQEAPSGKAVFAWSWVNASGNREFYMTCSDIEVTGGSGGSLKGPQMITPNYDSSSPMIGEFGTGGGDDGSNYYKERPMIEVSSSGTSSSSGGNSTSSTGTSGGYPSVSNGSGTNTASGSSPSSTSTGAGEYSTVSSGDSSASSGVTTGSAGAGAPASPDTSATAGASTDSTGVNNGSAGAGAPVSNPATPASPVTAGASTDSSGANQAGPNTTPSNSAPVDNGSYSQTNPSTPATSAGAGNPSGVTSGASSGSSVSTDGTSAGAGVGAVDPSQQSAGSTTSGNPSTYPAAGAPVVAQA